MLNQLFFSGKLKARLLRGHRRAIWAWRWRNFWRWPFLWGRLANSLAAIFTRLTGVPTITSELRAVLMRAGQSIDYGLVARRVVTDAGVAFLVDDWDNDAQNITTMNFHASGTGAVAEAVGDTALGAEATTITDRATGTKSQPTANQLRSVGTQAFTGTGAITEHGLLSSVTEGAGTLWDRSVFAAINVVNGDSIQWTYTCTVNSGG